MYAHIFKTVIRFLNLVVFNKCAYLLLVVLCRLVNSHFFLNIVSTADKNSEYLLL